MAIKQHACGDMLQYFADNPDKLKEKQESDAAKAKRSPIEVRLARLYARRNGQDYPIMKTQALSRLQTLADIQQWKQLLLALNAIPNAKVSPSKGEQMCMVMFPASTNLDAKVTKTLLTEVGVTVLKAKKIVGTQVRLVCTFEGSEKFAVDVGVATGKANFFTVYGNLPANVL